MERITTQLDDGTYFAASESIDKSDQGYSGRAIERLAAFENAYELLENKVEDLARKVDLLKAQNKINSSQGRQLVAQKITYSSMFNLLDIE